MGPHSHQVFWAEPHIYVPDLGSDTLYRCELSNEGQLQDSALRANLSPGSGPRHVDLHPTLPIIYLINELSSTIAVIDQRSMEILQYVNALPEDVERASTTAEIAVSADGTYVYGSNRGDDSISIIHDTGLGTQYSENREDSNSDHFLEEVSAIAFGAYHPEFDWQWGSAQETQNTYCGQGSPNQFMGPTLWPSSLSHFAVENQNNGNGLLGSHIDMNHESPDGMGIAHDSGNAYWYFDGYYGELVYYDFQEDHDTGQDDHSDGIVHRYVDIELTRDGGIPGHMVLDKESGILYIADTGKNRVLWVNTDDQSVSTTDILNSATQLEPLAEYKEKRGMEWGVLDTGLGRPSGIALEGDTLFVSENGNGQIVAMICLLYTSPSPRDRQKSRMQSSA